MRRRTAHHTTALRHGPTARQVKALLLWFARHARPLPWRRTTDPYAIWISEVMLQQTQVATVIPYWERWMRELPTVQALARASEPKVLKLWEGLGYYRRARHLQAAARQIVQRHGGQMPATLADFLELPGVGRYTAGAVFSIAYNQAAPILDGNVQRVLCRFHGITQSPRQAAVQKQLWVLAEAWVRQAAHIQKKAPGQFPRACSALNQALMELGAVVCNPRQPRCPLCPLRRACQACLQHLTDTLPLREQRLISHPRLILAAVVQTKDRVLVRQRPAQSVNGNLWEFPNIEVPAGGRATPPEAAQRQTLALWLRRELGIVARQFRPVGTLRHTITKYRYEVRLWQAEAASQSLEDGRARWVTRLELERLPMPAAHRRTASLFLTEQQGPKSKRSKTV